MTFIKNIIEPKRLFMFWQHPSRTGGTKKKFNIGELARADYDIYKLCYFWNSHQYKEAVARGCNGFYPYDISRSYYLDIDLSLFTKSIPQRDSPNFEKFCQCYNLCPKAAMKVSDFALMGFVRDWTNITFGLELS